MPKAKVTSKGQVTIPKPVREGMDLHAGDEVEFVKDEDGWRLRKPLAESPFAPWRGYPKELAGQDALIDEMRGR